MSEELCVGHLFGRDSDSELAFVGSKPHSLGPIGKRRCPSAGTASEPYPDLVCAAERPVPSALALAPIGEPITMTAKKVVLQTIELRHAPAADCTLDHTRAQEIRTATTEPAWHPDDRHGFVHILPVTAAEATGKKALDDRSGPSW
jgi:hypothetical protein